jgi:hypothetical protein
MKDDGCHLKPPRAAESQDGGTRWAGESRATNLRARQGNKGTRTELDAAGLDSILSLCRR